MTRALLIALATVLAAGCALTPRERPSIRYYELEAPAPEAAAEPVARTIRVGSFRGAGPSGTRMVYRRGPNEVALDDYHRWAAPPSQLIAREFYRGLLAGKRFTAVVANSDSAAADLEVSGDVLAVESTPQGQAHLELAIRIKEVATGRILAVDRHSLHQRLPEATPAALAATASALLADVIAVTADRLATIPLPPPEE